MYDREKHFSFSKNGDVYTLSDRIPFKWGELIIWTPTSFLILTNFLGAGVGIFVSILTLTGYVLFRFTSWVYYSELKIDKKSGTMFKLKKILHQTRKTELTTQKFNPNKFEYLELARSGKTRFLMSYRTHKNNELLILKSQKDKELIEDYIAEEVSC